nr:hypothetical protein Itr_chr09CG13750 [Ipomoea trifida]
MAWYKMLAILNVGVKYLIYSSHGLIKGNLKRPPMYIEEVVSLKPCLFIYNSLSTCS